MLQTHIEQTWLEVEGLRIHCFVAGQSGSPVILLHGGGMDSASISWGDNDQTIAIYHNVGFELLQHFLANRRDLR